MQLSEFDYDLPEALIATHPMPRREDSRLMDLRGAEPVDRQFTALMGLVGPGDVMVVNDTRVIKARVHGEKSSGGQIEVLLERPTPVGHWLVMMKASHPPKPGQVFQLGRQRPLSVEMVGRVDDLYEIRFLEPLDLWDWLDTEGELPIPPYMNRLADVSDEERYQTVYARERGAVAAPTAGLHFSAEFLDALRARGVEIHSVTLHVGAGTFQPVRVDRVEDHVMHKERYAIPKATREALRLAKSEGRRVMAVGTTSLRALEAASREASIQEEMAASGDTDIFITPGFEFQVVDRLLTNFHLPKSTLLMLVQAFGGRERLQRAYAHAVAQRYRFFSYGDAMLIDRKIAP